MSKAINERTEWVKGTPMTDQPYGRYVKDLWGFLPMPCPVCSGRLRYGKDDTGAVIAVTCDKCRSWWPEKESR